MTDTGTQISDDLPKRVRTITDLAKIAGVSAGTVSRALSGNNLVNTKTRQKIEAIAREHGFRPNQMASKLRRQKTGVIGVAIPLGHDERQQISDAFFMTLLGHLADQLTEKGYDIMLRRVIPSQDKDWLDRFIGSGMIDGVIVVGQSDQFERIEDVADGYLPMVVWGNHQEGHRRCVVGTDNRLGGKLAVEKLIASGCKSLRISGRHTANRVFGPLCRRERSRRKDGRAYLRFSDALVTGSNQRRNRSAFARDRRKGRRHLCSDRHDRCHVFERT